MKTDSREPADLVLKLLCAKYTLIGSEETKRDATQIIIAVSAYLSTIEGHFEAAHILQNIADDLMLAGKKRQPDLKRNTIV